MLLKNISHKERRQKEETTAGRQSWKSYKREINAKLWDLKAL